MEDETYSVWWWVALGALILVVCFAIAFLSATANAQTTPPYDLPCPAGTGVPLRQSTVPATDHLRAIECINTVTGVVTYVAGMGPGGGTVTHTPGPLTAGVIVVGNGAADVKVMAADPAQCGAGNVPTGIDKNGAAKGCVPLVGAGTVTNTGGALTLNSLMQGAGGNDSKTMAADPAQCAAGSGPTGIDKTGAAKGCAVLPVGTVTDTINPLTLGSLAVGNGGNDLKVLAADPANCPAGQAAKGIDKNGAAKGCAAVGTGNGTVTHTPGPLTLNAIMIGNGADDAKVQPGNFSPCAFNMKPTGIDRFGAAVGCTAVASPTSPGQSLFTSTNTGVYDTVVVPANTETTVMHINLTFPATVGTYKALGAYTLYGTGSNTCVGVIYDSTSAIPFAASYQDSNGGGGHVGLSDEELELHTYAQGSVVAYQLKVICNGPETMTTTPALFPVFVNQVAHFTLTPMLSQ